MDDLKQQLEKAVQRRDKLQGQVQRAAGRLESARESLDEVLEECKEKGLDPKTLGQTIQGLKQNLITSLGELTKKLDEAEVAVTPFLETEGEA